MDAVTPRTTPAPVRYDAVRELSEAECWRRLGAARVGRIAIRTDHDVEIFPVSYLVVDRCILLRSGPGTKMFHLARHPEVAFEVDDRRGGRAWSVVAHGRAERLNNDADIEASGIRALLPDHPGEKFNYVRITPTGVSGRWFATPAKPPFDIIAAVAVGIVVVALGALSIVIGR